jgi:uncharacterized protein
VGTSIQGPREVHDCTRIDLAGHGTYNRVISRIKDLEEKPSIITVLTKEILGKEEETYRMLKKYSRGARISEYFPREHMLSNNKVSNLEGSMPSSIEYGQSMIKFYTLWKKDKHSIDLRPITEIIQSFVHKKANGCIYSQQSCNFIVLGVKENGDFYTCLRAAGNKNFFLGNVLKTNPLKKFLSFSKRDYKNRMDSLKKEGCLNCEFFNQCGGGCPQESLKLWGDYAHKTYYCEGRKRLFQEIKKDLNKIKNEI